MSLLAPNPIDINEMSNPYVLQESYELFNDCLTALDGPAVDEPVSYTQIPVPHLSHASQPLHSNPPHNVDIQIMSASPIAPPTIPRKRKAPTLRADAWEPYKDRIIQLHIKQELPLPKVMDIIQQEFGFSAELRQYRRRITQWNLDKNVKKREMKAIVRKRQRRKILEVDKKELVFTVRGNKVDAQKIERWMKRNGVSESLPYHPSPDISSQRAAATPSDVFCRTISECGLTPAHSVATPVFSPRSIMSVARTAEVASPTPSISSRVQLQSSTFSGHSPPPIHLPLPGFSHDSPHAPKIFQDNLISIQSYLFYGAQPPEIEDPAPNSLGDRYRQADEDRLREKVSELEMLYGPDHFETLATLSELGEVLIDQGRYRSAGELARVLVTIRQTASGDDDVTTLDALELLGRVFTFKALYDKSEELHQRIFSSRNAILGKEHPSTLKSMANLGLVYHHQHRWAEAEGLQVQALELRKRILGAEHPDTLATMADLAATYGGQGRLKENEEIGRQVMETRKKILGEWHPSTLESMDDLATVIALQGRLIEAAALDVQTFEMRKRILGQEHPDTLVSMANLATRYVRLGLLQEAQELQAADLNISLRVLGKEHPSTLMSMHNLAYTLKCKNQNHEAISLMRECFQIRKRILGPHHVDTGDSLETLNEWQINRIMNA